MRKTALAALFLAGVLCAEPAMAQFPPPRGEDLYWVEDTIKNMTTRGMTKEQIAEQFKQYGINLSGSTIADIINGQLGVNSDIGYELAAALMNGDKEGFKRYLINQGWLLADDLIEQYTNNVVGLIKGGMCSSMVMDAVAVAASSVAGFFTGGRATVVAQLAQQVQLAWANKCNGEMNDSLRSLAEYERKNISNGSVNVSPGIEGMMSRTLPGLGSAGYLSSEQAITNQYQFAYPNAFPPMTGDDLTSINRAMTLRERQARMTAAGVQNRAVIEQQSGLNRARQFAEAGRDGPGIRAELQAGNAIQTEQLGAINSLTAATVAGQRVELERRLRDDAKTAAANARADDYMASLGVCANCGINRSILE